jgi:hypothetical protein
MSKNNHFQDYEMKLFLVVFIALLFLAGCKEYNKIDCLCTQEFRMITVEITDSLNRPLTNLQTRTINMYGKTIIPLYKKLDFQPNLYVIADDSNLNSLTTLPTAFVFIVTDSVKSNSYNYVLNTDDCKCHINKIEGPQKIIF